VILFFGWDCAPGELGDGVARYALGCSEVTVFGGDCGEACRGPGKKDGKKKNEIEIEPELCHGVSRMECADVLRSAV